MTDLATDEQVEAIRVHAKAFRKRGARAAQFSLEGIEGLLARLELSERALKVVSDRATRLERIEQEHRKVLDALGTRILNPVADGGGAWHYELENPYDEPTA